jgi:nitrite reductase (NADH) small subunit
MSEFVKALPVEELPPGRGTELSLGGQAVALFNVEGRFYAISNTCLHRGGPLGQGFVEGSTVTCPWHAWTFDVTNGRNVVNGELKVMSYETKVEDGHVLVKVG